MMTPFKIGFKEILQSEGTSRIKTWKLLDYILGTFLTTICPAAKRREAPDKISHLLIIRPGGIGDAIFLLPILKMIRHARPAITIDILCEKRNVEIFTSQRNLCHNIFCYDKLKDIFAVSRKRYDIIIDTEQWHYLSALTAYFLKADYRIGFATRPRRSKLFHKKIDYRMDEYELENFKRLFEPVLKSQQIPNDIQDSFEITQDAREWAQRTLRGENYLSLFLGASILPRRLTAAQAKDVIQTFAPQGYSIILLGGKDAQETAHDIKNSRPDTVMDFTGQTTLMQSAALIEHSRLFIGPDSGLMHLACAVGTPVIAIFGPGNVRKWGPQGAQHQIITKNLVCSPCTWFGYTLTTCKKEYPCRTDTRTILKNDQR